MCYTYHISADEKSYKCGYVQFADIIQQSDNAWLIYKYVNQQK